MNDENMFLEISTATLLRQLEIIKVVLAPRPVHLAETTQNEKSKFQGGAFGEKEILYKRKKPHKCWMYNIFLK